jgi:hypothetical protein
LLLSAKKKLKPKFDAVVSILNPFRATMIPWGSGLVHRVARRNCQNTGANRGPAFALPVAD